MRAITEPPEQATGNYQHKPATGTQRQISRPQDRLKTDTGVRRASQAEWQMPEPAVSYALPEGDVQMPPLVGTGTGGGATLSGSSSGSLPGSSKEEKSTTAASQVVRGNYNYSALVSALQTLGYSLPGFIAAAVVSIDGQPIAQVSVDDLNISRICKHFSNVLKGTLQSLDQGMWGDYEDSVITSSDRYILMRIIGSERSMFQVLITTREVKPAESLEVMANVEGAISAALHSS
jgi:predicted regulator of Ras-like GTPase activity (Roadblock/LC7/MglB family)